MLYWRFCKHCKQRIGIDSYPFNQHGDYRDDVTQALDTAMEKHLKTCTGAPKQAKTGDSLCSQSKTARN